MAISSTFICFWYRFFFSSLYPKPCHRQNSNVAVFLFLLLTVFVINVPLYESRLLNPKVNNQFIILAREIHFGISREKISATNWSDLLTWDNNGNSKYLKFKKWFLILDNGSMLRYGSNKLRNYRVFWSFKICNIGEHVG